MKKRTPLKRILKYIKPHTGSLILVILSAVISVCASLYAPILIGNAIDKMIGIGNVDFDYVIEVIIELIIISLVYSIFNWLLGFSTTSLSNKTVEDIRKDAFEKIATVPLKYLDNTPQGELISRIITDVENISTGLLQGFTQLVSGIVTIIGTLIFMLLIKIKLAIVVAVLTPLSLFVASFIAKGTHKMFSKQLKIAGELTSLASEMIENQKLIKMFNYEDIAISRYKEINDELNKYGYKAQVYSALTNPATRFVNALVYAAVGIIGAFIVVNEKNLNLVNAFSVGSLYTFLTYANQYTKPFNEISNVINEFQTAISSAERVFAVIDSETEISDENLPILEKAEGNIQLENVYFSYREDQHLIEDFNLVVKPGERIAIVGPTGCGKTTLINLLMRFYDVKSGKISLENKDIREITRASLRENYGMVLQDTWLFSGTIYENIAYGKSDATMEEVVAACKRARIHSYIEKLKQGYDTYIADCSSLSEGQKQLMCIARIMLLDPSILILDEATSSIDTLTEIEIQKSFQEMMVGKTSFIIAHRLSTIQNADKILVMKDGNVVEIGKHEELLNKKGFYYNLYNSQFEH